jgi:hypothetical protein
MKRTRSLLSAALLCAALLPSPVLAWGAKGHTIVNHLAALGFTGRMPGFLTNPKAVYAIGYLGPELDRDKGAGPSWDADYDTGHFLDLNDDGTVAGVVQLSALPKNREAYDTALRAANTDQYKAGFLPYTLLDGWEQLRQDLAYWRVDDYRATHGATPADRLAGARDRDIDQNLVLRDVGVWGHYVGDACQPLHVTVHFNGWGNYPNPNGYTESTRTHSMFESEFVNRYVTEAAVAKLIPAKSAYPVPASPITQEEMLERLGAYLLATGQTVPHLYDIEKAGGFASGSPEAVQFTTARLAAGATELRDLAVLAWQDSLNASVGYPAIPVRDVLSGKAKWPAVHSQM